LIRDLKFKSRLTYDHDPYTRKKSIKVKDQLVRNIEWKQQTNKLVEMRGKA